MTSLWPDASYIAQLERLRGAIGRTVYLVEVNAGEVQLGISMTGTAYVLLAVLPFPRPDPSRGLAPHFLLLDDGRGVNLGRIARVSYTPFAPQAADIVYQDAVLTDTLLFAPRRLSKALIAERSRQVLAQLLGKPAPPLLEPPHEE